MTLYDYLNKEEDPLFQTIIKVDKENRAYIGQYEISINQSDLYEILSVEEHIPAWSIDDCYKKIKQLLTKL